MPQALSKDPVTGASTDLGPLKALQCILRANSQLAVIFLADEDDCSVQITKRDQTDPAVRNCGPLLTDSYDCYCVEYRCFSGSVVAGIWRRGNAPAPIGKVVSYHCASTLRW